MRSEKLVLMTLVEKLHLFAHLQEVQLEQVILIFKPDTLLRWHRELVRRKWILNNPPKQDGQLDVQPRFLIRDNDSKYGAALARAASGIEIVRTPFVNAFWEVSAVSVSITCGSSMNGSCTE